MENVRCAKCMLRSFELVSGLKINFHKIKLATIGGDGDFISRATTYLNYGLVEGPYVYLGIPISANPRNEAIATKSKERWKVFIKVRLNVDCNQPSQKFSFNSNF
ncbi:hypothetical protein GmHk_15G044354 [Glycine max]|nr:hypothetical protein GmHk_15G044354 [Glycine max]